MHNKIFQLMKENLALLKNTKQKVFQTNGNGITYFPFFSSLFLRDHKNYIIDVENGSVNFYQKPYEVSNYPLRLEIRIGDSKEGGGVSTTNFYYPSDLKKHSANQAFIRAANEAFWDCAEDLESRYKDTLGKSDSKKRIKYVYFSKEKPNNFFQKEEELKFDAYKLIKEFKDITQKLQRPWVRNLGVYFSAQKDNTYFMNSEGTQIFQSNILFITTIAAEAVDDKHLIIPHRIRFQGLKPPTYSDVFNNGKRVVSELEEILKAPDLTNGVFPTILDGECVGVTFHEVIGHGLEGHRLQYEGEQETNLFKGKKGEKIAPNFINLFDNPRKKFLNKQFLTGFYLYDEEGVKSQRVNLIENGILNNYLHSRQSAGFLNEFSNGHSRSEGVRNPCPRMSNTFVSSSNPVSIRKLKRQLIQLCEKKNKPFGLLFKQMDNGWVIPEESFYNSYPVHVFKVHKNGKMQRVRGVYIVGTPYQTLDSFVSMTNRQSIFQGFCGAESGSVRNTIIAPDALVDRIEVNKIPDDSYLSVHNSIFKR